jgi:hypothetical protein
VEDVSPDFALEVSEDSSRIHRATLLKVATLLPDKGGTTPLLAVISVNSRAANLVFSPTGRVRSTRDLIDRGIS